MVNKKSFKIISIITTVFVITTLISLKGVITKADGASRPEFEIEFDKIRDEALVGEDILVTGKIKPKPFEVDIKNMDTEIIIVMDRNTTKKEFGEVINSLRKDIGNFINNIPLTGNVKLGLIDYTNDANIFKYNNNALINISDKDKIANEVYKFKVDEEGYSNTGEALRKTSYLMESLKSNGIKNKIILLFSDGYPTARTVYSNGDAYTDITKEGYGDAQIQTSKSDYTKDIEYAKTIGNKIKENGYTVYTIGYNVETESEKAILRDIYQSMTGDTSDNRFYILPHKKITGEVNEEISKIFNRLEEDILKSYSLNNIKMNLNFTGDFSLNIGGNTVNLNSINYKLVSQSNDGKARYEAEPIPFEFILKGKTEGEKQQIFDKVTITYPWKDSIEKVDINSPLYITINSNEIPTISANLISDKIINIEENDKFTLNQDNSKEITLEYRVTPKEFATSDISISNKEIGEVIFIVGLSNNMSSNTAQRNNYLQNFIPKVTSELKTLKYGVIGYNDSDYYVGDNIDKSHTEYNTNYMDLKNNPTIDKINYPLYDVSGNLINEFKEYFFQDKDKSILKKTSPDSNKVVNIDGSLNIAIDIFDKFGDKNKGKAIVLINSDTVKYSENIANKIKNKGYKVISLDLTADVSKNFKNMHLSMGGVENDYISALYDGSNFNSVDDEKSKVVLRLKGNADITTSYVVNPTLTFDLNDNFDYLGKYNENVKLNSLNGNVVKFTLSNPIEYTYSNRQDQNGEYIFNSTKEHIDIKFTVKVKNNKIGTLTFAENINILDTSTYKNYFEYNNFKGTVNKSPLETPKVIVREQIKDITHGLYNGINNGQVSISETNSGKDFEIAQGSTVTFGATFTFSGSTNFKLNVDKNIQGIDKNNIKIYQILNGGLVNIDDKEISGENNEFNIAINVGNNTEILVVYQGKIIDGTASGQTLTNDIVFSSISKKATIITPQQSTDSPILPDLF